MFDPVNYPLTGQWWMDHHDQFIIGHSPIVSDIHYGNLLDYSYEEVRAYRLAVIREIIDRYSDIMDGLELDFNRVQVLFPKDRASASAPLVTEMLVQIRKMLVEKAKETRRTYWLFVRIPPTLHNCEWAGLDIAQWMDQKLVDVILPSQLMTLAQDMPVDEFVALARPAGCRVYPSIYPRTSYTWDFVPHPTEESFSSPAKREVSTDLVRGAAANYWQMGATGFQLYNFHHEDNGLRPYSDRLYRVMRDLSCPQALNQANKVFSITPAYYLDHEDSYEFRKQVPFQLEAGKSQKLKLWCGDDWSQTSAEFQPKYTGLRLGLKNATPSTNLTVILNDQSIYEGVIGKHLEEAKGNHPKTAPDEFVQFDIPSTQLHRGPNQLIISVGDVDKPVSVAEVCIGVFYTQEYLKLIE